MNHKTQMMAHDDGFALSGAHLNVHMDVIARICVRERCDHCWYVECHNRMTRIEQMSKNMAWGQQAPIIVDVSVVGKWDR